MTKRMFKTNIKSGKLELTWLLSRSNNCNYI